MTTLRAGSGEAAFRHGLANVLAQRSTFVFLTEADPAGRRNSAVLDEIIDAMSKCVSAMLTLSAGSTSIQASILSATFWQVPTMARCSWAIHAMRFTAGECSGLCAGWSRITSARCCASPMISSWLRHRAVHQLTLSFHCETSRS